MRVESELTQTFVSGWLCLEFVNSVDNRNAAEIVDRIPDYATLLAWGVRVGLLKEAERDALLAHAKLEPTVAQGVLASAKRLREALYGIFTAIVGDARPRQEDLGLLNERMAEVFGHLEIRGDGDEFAWHWQGKEGRLDAILWPIVRSAALLLTAPDLDRLRQCGGDNCTWLFLDKSKNRSRRWCEMEVCGNRAKSKRHYARMRGTVN